MAKSDLAIGFLMANYNSFQVAYLYDLAFCFNFVRCGRWNEQLLDLGCSAAGNDYMFDDYFTLSFINDHEELQKVHQSKDLWC